MLLNLGGDQLHPMVEAEASRSRLAAVQTSLDEADADQAEDHAARLHAHLNPPATIVTLGRLGAVVVTHTLYVLDGFPTTVPDEGQDHEPPLDLTGRLQATMTRTETAGDIYTLHHSMIHAVVAEPYTTTLIVRCPAVKEKFFLTDRATGRSWWQYGAATESQQETADKRLHQSGLHARIGDLAAAGVLT